METRSQEILSLLESELENDNLFAEIKQRREEYAQLTSGDFLEQLDTKKWYSTVEAAEMFGISDSKLRYYIKPLFNYILPEDTPSSSVAYRLNYLSIIKLKMILLLKDEFKVAGIQTLIGYRGRIVNTSKEKGLVESSDQAKRIEQLETLLGEFLKTGLFNVNSTAEGSKLEINLDFFQEKMPKNLIGNEEVQMIKEELDSLKIKVEEEQEEKEKLRKDFMEKIEEERIEKEKLYEELKNIKQKDDVAVRLRDRQKIQRLELEASQEWDKRNKGFKKIFSNEYDKRKFINEFVESKMTEQ